VVGCWCVYLSGTRCSLAYGPADAIVSCFSKIQIGLPFWYRPTHVVPEKGLLNVCVLGCFKNSIKICSYCRPHRVHNIDKACCYRFNQHGCLYISWSVRELSVIGGSTLEDATRRIMRTVFTTNLALQYNWTGHGSKKSAV